MKRIDHAKDIGSMGRSDNTGTIDSLNAFQTADCQGMCNDQAICDSHIHCLSPDALVPMEDMCRAAVEKGVSLLTVTDHFEIYRKDCPILYHGFTMEYLERYYRDYLACRERFQGKLTLLLGLELGQPGCDPNWAAQVVAKLPFDYIIGSAHKIRNRDLGEQDYRPDTIKEILRENLEVLWQLADEGDFDCLGHIDLIHRYSSRAGCPVELMEEAQQVEAILRRLAQRGKGLEINTSELRRGGGTMPGPDILRLYKEVGGEVLTVGSDAHRPQDVSAGFRRAVELAWQAGFTRIAYYKGREPQFISIGD